MGNDLFALFPHRPDLYSEEFQGSPTAGLIEQVSRLVEGEVRAGLHRSRSTVRQDPECGAG